MLSLQFGIVTTQIVLDELHEFSTYKTCMWGLAEYREYNDVVFRPNTHVFSHAFDSEVPHVLGKIFIHFFLSIST